MGMGPAPWETGYRKATKKTQKAYNYAFEENHGWVPKSNFGKQRKTTTRPITLSNGEVVYVYDVYDNSDLIQYNSASINSVSAGDTDKLDKYITTAFPVKPNPNASKRGYTCAQGAGHILWLEYYAPRQLLRVTFKIGGRTCIFFRVPSTVAGELIHLCDSRFIDTSRKDKEHNHVLGIRFWDLIRIRGSRTGAKYLFKYTNEAVTVPAALRDEVNKQGGIEASHEDIERRVMYRPVNEQVTLDQYNTLRDKQESEIETRWQNYKQSGDALFNDKSLSYKDKQFYINQLKDLLKTKADSRQLAVLSSTTHDNLDKTLEDLEYLAVKLNLLGNEDDNDNYSDLKSKN